MLVSWEQVDAARAEVLRSQSLGLHGASDEGGRGFRHRVVHRDAGTFVQDLDAEDLGRAHRAVLIAPESEPAKLL